MLVIERVAELTVHALLLAFVVRHDIFASFMISTSIFLFEFIRARGHRSSRQSIFVIARVSVGKGQFNGINRLGFWNFRLEGRLSYPRLKSALISRSQRKDCLPEAIGLLVYN